MLSSKVCKSPNMVALRKKKDYLLVFMSRGVGSKETFESTLNLPFATPTSSNPDPFSHLHTCTTAASDGSGT